MLYLIKYFNICYLVIYSYIKLYYKIYSYIPSNSHIKTHHKISTNIPKIQKYSP